MAQVPASKAKSRRYRGAKISEHRLKRVVECFARDMNAKDAAEATRLSRPSVEAIYRRLRERLSQHPIVNLISSAEPSPAMRTIVNRKSQGVAEADHRLHEMAVLTRILNAQHFDGFEELSAADPEHVAKAVRLMKMKVNGRPRYHLHERLAARPGDTTLRTRPFDPLSLEPTSAILVNEVKADPHEAHFRYIWKLLLDHPL